MCGCVLYVCVGVSARGGGEREVVCRHEDRRRRRKTLPLFLFDHER